MPPRRIRNRNATGTSRKPPTLRTRRSARLAAGSGLGDANDGADAIPAVYGEMLAEAYREDPGEFKGGRVGGVEGRDGDGHVEVGVEPVGEGVRGMENRSGTPDEIGSLGQSAPAKLQVVYSNDLSDASSDDVNDDDDDNEDLEFEDVDLDAAATNETNDENEQPKPRALQLDLSAPTPKNNPRRTIPRRKPPSKAERAHRLAVHKWHLCCLLIHLATRSNWANDETIQKRLKPLVARKTINQLHLETVKGRPATQAERKFAFERAITEVCAVWEGKFRVTERGMRRATWREELNVVAEVEGATDPVDFEDFRGMAGVFTGSRDVGAQLFCALLRALAVETRLVCSLQVLPFGGGVVGEGTPGKGVGDPGQGYIHAGAQDFGTTLGSTGSASRGKKSKKVVDSPFPIWWVEVFSPAISQWLPLDPIVRNTINKPRTGFEPPGSDSLNGLSYVIGFDDDGTAKDVTRRYTGAYNAKTRRTRVESTKGGEAWYHAVLSHFSRSHPTTPDAIEDAELDRRVAMEGMPKNVQDFKDHPVYVLERHLRQNEVIYPRRECGRFSVGTGKSQSQNQKQKLESVFRRGDVYGCRSAEGWYRRGRDVKAGEVAVKRVVPRRGRGGSAAAGGLFARNGEGEYDEVEEGVPLYAEFQTDVYVPPSVVEGKVPRNGYGNLDVYVESMIPAGGVHMRHPLGGQAAKILKIDAAEAVTGFKFKGRQGTAIVDGLVVDRTLTAAMVATVAALEDQLEDEINAVRNAIVLGVWKKMMAVLRVRQRIDEEYGGRNGENTLSAGKGNDDDEDDDDETYNALEEEEEAGGFAAEAVGEATTASKAEEAANLALLKEKAPIELPPLVVRQKIVVVRSPHKVETESLNGPVNDDDDLFGDDEQSGKWPHDDTLADGSGGFVVDDTADRHVHGRGGGFVANNDDEDGGFVPGDDDAGGEFVPDDNDQGGGSVDEDDGNAGGFVPEEDEVTHFTGPVDNPFHPKHTSGDGKRPSRKRRAPTDRPEDDAGGGFVPGDSAAAVPEQRPICAEGISNPIKPRTVNENVQKPVRVRRASTDDDLDDPQRRKAEINGHPPLLTQESMASTRSAKGKQKAEIDRDSSEAEGDSDYSMPSHDPEEDDADPQWVEDAFDDDV